MKKDHDCVMPKKTGKTTAKPHTATTSSKISALEKRLERLEDELFNTRKAAIRTETRLRGEILGLQLQIKKKDEQIESLVKSNTYLRNRLFGSQTEKDDVKPSTQTDAVQQKVTRKRGQQPGSKGHGRTVKFVAKQTEVELPVQQTCCTKCSREFLLLDATKDS